MQTSRDQLSKRNAFSLVEILVAIAVLSLLILLLVGVTNQAGRAWLLGLGQNQRRSVGRILLDYVARDLKAATVPAGTFVPGISSTPPADLQFFASISRPPSASNPTAIPVGDMNPHAIFWQAPVAVYSTHGNIAEVGYFVKWDTSRPGVALAQMCRFLVDPDTFDSTTGNTPSGSNFLIFNRDVTTGNPLNWLSVVDTVAPATAPNYQGWFADNVIALWARCLDTSGQPITLNAAGAAYPSYGYDSRQGYTDSTGGVHPGPVLPAAVDIALVTVDSVTANHITAPLTATITTSADMLKDQTVHGSVDYFMDNLPAAVKPGAQVYSTTVYIPTK